MTQLEEKMSVNNDITPRFQDFKTRLYLNILQ